MWSEASPRTKLPAGVGCQRGYAVSERPSEQLRRAQELLRWLRRRGREVPGPEELAATADLPAAALQAAARGRVERRLALPSDGTVPVGAGLTTRELAAYRVAAGPVLAAELEVAPSAEVEVRELLVVREGVPLQFRSSSSSGPVADDADLARPVDVEAVRADAGTAQALAVPEGTVVLLQVVLRGVDQGARRLDFVYSRADLVRVETR